MTKRRVYQGSFGFMLSAEGLDSIKWVESHDEVELWVHTKHNQKVDGFIWCDVHCGTHEAVRDPFTEGNEECNRENWRDLWMEPDL